jgi:hypothetical protein
MPRLNTNRDLPTSFPEIVPLLVGLVGISIPVGLLALAAVGGGTIVLVLAGAGDAGRRRWNPHLHIRANR